MADINTSLSKVSLESNFKSPLNGYLNNQGRLQLKGASYDTAKHPRFLPTFNTKENYEPIQPFAHHDPGLRADPAFPNLFPKDKKSDIKVQELTPKFGSEIQGVQISKLNSAGLDELALFVAQRGVVAFQKQDLKDQSFDFLEKLGSHFGPNHVHPTSGAPEKSQYFHIVYRDENDKAGQDQFFEQHTSSVRWHSDVSYERQPAGTTFLAMLEKPGAGGDTLFTDARQAYQRLSPAFRQRLDGLELWHSGIEQVESSKARGGVVRRAPVKNKHPLLRTHPVTKETSLYVNQGFGRNIDGLKVEESQALLNFLYDHIAKGADFQVRIRWDEDTVVVWDNRITAHSALVDWDSGERRHAFRITPEAEEPFYDPQAEKELAEARANKAAKK